MMLAVTASGVADLDTILAEEILARRRDPSLVAVNVLTPQQFERSRIPGSINLPYAELERRAAGTLPDPARELAVHCGSFT
jgi:rhodanese-related sulfurtransferase